MAKNWKKQTIKPSTKKTIDDRVRKKSQLTKHLDIFYPGVYVEYYCQDGTTNPYFVLEVVKDNDGIYSIKVQAIDENGKFASNIFQTTADKIGVIWCQPGDRVKYEHQSGRGTNRTITTLYGHITKISNTGIIVYTFKDEGTGTETFLTSDHFPQMELAPEED